VFSGLCIIIAFILGLSFRLARISLFSASLQPIRILISLSRFNKSTVTIMASTLPMPLPRQMSIPLQSVEEVSLRYP
jgi:hypothetical protein